MECMFCKRTGERTFDLYSRYGCAPNSIRDDLVEFFGSDIEVCLNEAEDFLCNTCMNMIESLTKLKRVLVKILVSPREQKNAKKLGKFWDNFKRFTFDEFLFYCDDFGGRSETPLSFRSRPSTPSNLLVQSYSKDFNEEIESKVAFREYCKSQVRSVSRGSSQASSYEEHDKEVQAIFERRRRRRGHGWTHRKRSESAPTKSDRIFLPRVRKRRRREEERNLMDSPTSECSYVSYTRPKKDWTPRKPKLIYENDELVIRRTRAVSRLEEEIIHDKKEEEKHIFYCRIDDCPIYLTDLELFTMHRVEEHNCLPLYPCHICFFKFTTEEHLKIHSESHQKTYYFCPRCQEKFFSFEELHKHEQEHLTIAAECKYCDLSFVGKKLLKEHVERVHSKGPKIRIRRRPIDHLVHLQVFNTDKDLNEQITKQRRREEKFDRNFKSKPFESRIYSLKIKPSRDLFDNIDYVERGGSSIINLTIPIQADNDSSSGSDDLDSLTEAESVSLTKRLSVPLERMDILEHKAGEHVSRESQDNSSCSDVSLKGSDVTEDDLILQKFKEKVVTPDINVTHCSDESSSSEQNIDKFAEIIHSELDLEILDSVRESPSLNYEAPIIIQENITVASENLRTLRKKRKSFVNEEPFSENLEIEVDSAVTKPAQGVSSEFVESISTNITEIIHAEVDPLSFSEKPASKEPLIDTSEDFGFKDSSTAKRKTSKIKILSKKTMSRGGGGGLLSRLIRDSTSSYIKSRRKKREELDVPSQSKIRNKKRETLTNEESHSEVKTTEIIFRVEEIEDNLAQSDKDGNEKISNKTKAHKLKAPTRESVKTKNKLKELNLDEVFSDVLQTAGNLTLQEPVKNKKLTSSEAIFLEESSQGSSSGTESSSSTRSRKRMEMPITAEETFTDVQMEDSGNEEPSSSETKSRRKKRCSPFY